MPSLSWVRLNKEGGTCARRQLAWFLSGVSSVLSGQIGNVMLFAVVLERELGGCCKTQGRPEISQSSITTLGSETAYYLYLLQVIFHCMTKAQSVALLKVTVKSTLGTVSENLPQANHSLFLGPSTPFSQMG
jgi:hypothetical protein